MLKADKIAKGPACGNGTTYFSAIHLEERKRRRGKHGLGKQESERRGGNKEGIRGGEGRGKRDGGGEGNAEPCGRGRKRKDSEGEGRPTAKVSSV